MTDIKKDYPKPQQVGQLSFKIINLLKINYKPQKIFIGRTNIKHIKKRHPEEFEQYLQRISDIIANPDYVGQNPRQGSIEYIKVFEHNVLVAVRASKSGTLFVRSMYTITEAKLKRYLTSNRLVKVQ